MGRARGTFALALALATAAAGAAGCDVAGRGGPDVPHTSGAVPTAPRERAPSPLGTPLPVPLGSGGFAFSFSHADGSPVAFDPCRALHYVVRPNNSPAGGPALVASVLADVTGATGLRLVDDGSTTEAPVEDRSSFQPAVYGDRWAPVLIAWSTTAETTMLPPNVLGRAGPTMYGARGHGSDVGRDARYVSGVAVFNGPAIDRQLRSGEEAKARAVLLHELGHLVGLGHVTDPYQVMFDTNAFPLARYRAGDLRGLERLGRGQCFAGP